MDASLDMSKDWELILKEKMKEFPHFLHLRSQNLTQDRLKGLLENLEEESDSDDVCEEETIFKLNFKSFVYTRLADRKKAEEINDKVLTLTCEKNIMSVGNRVFFNWSSGRETDALECLDKLQKMKNLPDFDERLTSANAELAYSYSRIGGPTNLFTAIDLFEKCIQKYPEKFYWKLRLGLAYRRCTHLNIYTGMPRGHTFTECVEKSQTILNDVYENSGNNKLRGPACSELAVLCQSVRYQMSERDNSRIFRKTPDQLAMEALKCTNDSTWVLTNCGKVHRGPKAVDKAIDLLQRCLTLRKHTTTHHQLGIVYSLKAKYISSARPAGSTRVTPRGRRNVPVYTPQQSRGNQNSPKVKLPNEYFDKAEREYQKAIEMSHGKNLPATYSLGLLYQDAGLDDKSLKMFNQITNTGGEGHLITLINAYEQAGQYYLKKNEKSLAEAKLTRAISLAATVALTCPQLQDCATEVWTALSTMKTLVASEQPSPERDKKLVRLLELVRDHGSVVKVVQEVVSLRGQLEDVDVIASGLKGHLNLGDPENALTFLNMVSMQPCLMNSKQWNSEAMISLKSRVFLMAIKNRLENQSGEVRMVFRDLFKLHYGHCSGQVTEETESVSSARDVLLLYDDAHDTETAVSQISKTVQVLQDVFSEVFGLDTSRNLESCNDYGPKLSVQLEEMFKYQVVIVIFGEEERDEEFQSLLEMTPSLRAQKSPTKILVINAQQKPVDVPRVLQHILAFNLNDIGGLGETSRGAISGGDSSSVGNIIRNVFDGDIHALLQLFCYIVGQKWPCAD